MQMILLLSVIRADDSYVQCKCANDSFMACKECTYFGSNSAKHADDSCMSQKACRSFS